MSFNDEHTEAMGPHEAHAQPTHKFQADEREEALTELVQHAEEHDLYEKTSVHDDSLDALARDMEAAGHPKWAARLSVLARDLDPYLLPQMPVSAPVPEPRLPELHEQGDA